MRIWEASYDVNSDLLPSEGPPTRRRTIYVVAPDREAAMSVGDPYQGFALGQTPGKTVYRDCMFLSERGESEGSSLFEEVGYLVAGTPVTLWRVEYDSSYFGHEYRALEYILGDVTQAQEYIRKKLRGVAYIADPGDVGDDAAVYALGLGTHQRVSLNDYKVVVIRHVVAPHKRSSRLDGGNLRLSFAYNGQDVDLWVPQEPLKGIHA